MLSVLNTQYFRYGGEFQLTVRPLGCDFYVENISVSAANFSWQSTIRAQYIY